MSEAKVSLSGFPGLFRKVKITVLAIGALIGSSGKDLLPNSSRSLAEFSSLQS